MKRVGEKCRCSWLAALAAAFFICLQSVCAQTPLFLKKRIFRTAIKGPVERLDPGTYLTYGEQVLLRNLTDPLLRVDTATGAIVANAAKSFELLADKRTWVFKLREDLRWSNGQPITAKDYAFGLRRTLTPSTRSPHQTKLSSIEGGAELLEGKLLAPGDVGITVVSDKELRLRLKAPDTFFPWVLTQPFSGAIQEEALSRNGYARLSPTTFLSSGPWMFQSMTAQEAVLVPNPHHRLRSTLKLDEVHVALIDDPYKALRRFLQGGLDQFGHADFGVPQSEVPTLLSHAAFTRQVDARVVYLQLNVRRVPLSQPLLRQALAMALDRKLLLQALLLPETLAAYAPLPPLGKFYESPTVFLPNAAQARVLFAQSGVCPAGETSLTCQGSFKPEIAYVSEPRMHKTALALGALLRAQLPLEDVVLRSLTPSEFESLERSGTAMILLKEVSAAPDYPWALIEALSPKDKHLQRALTSPLNEALEALRQLEARLMTEEGLIPLYYGDTPMLVSPRVQGFSPHVTDIHLWQDLGVTGF